MSFKASKKREVKKPDPVGEGRQLIPSAAVRAWYVRRMQNVTAAMLADYKASIRATLQTREVRKFFAQDASAASAMQELMTSLNKKWISIFKNYAKETAAAFAAKVDAHSKATCFWSLSAAGVKQPRLTFTENVANTINASKDFNNTLITGIQADAHDKIYGAVMLSLTSPNPEEQGVSGIEAALKKTGEFTNKRIELIARDQNSKLYSSLNTDRMQENGVDKFRWMHSSAGKVPRPSHVAKDGEIFTHDDARLWEGPKGDQGPPGWAINCRCRAIPIID
jgi:SPP1 gp7 family putative phage head morphogenesis protein